MDFPAIWNRLESWGASAGKVPFLGVLVLALFLQVMKENYPFSHYPMYSGLTDNVEYYYLTNAKGEPVPQGIYFGLSTSWTKKMLNTRLNKITGGRNIDSASPAEISEAGRQTLQYLVEHRLKEDRRAQVARDGLQLHQVYVERKGDKLLTTPSFIAELPPQ